MAAPYPQNSELNAIYEMLFCDDPESFRPKPDVERADWQAALFAEPVDPARVMELAQDETAESRIRALAFHWLRANGHQPPKGLVLGVIFEVPQDQGLDVLAAYADGRVRYLNQAGGMTAVEPDAMPDIEALARRVVALAAPIVAGIGPWDQPRLPPPLAPAIRISFLVSDGLYFGQGAFEALNQDAGARALIEAGTQLLSAVVDAAVKDHA